jgi:Zinc finger, C3HC4 type (RING finger)/RING-type zinc-finger
MGNDQSAFKKDINICPICNKLIANENVIELSVCKHHFCLACLVNFLKVSRDAKCPISACSLLLSETEAEAFLIDDSALGGESQDKMLPELCDENESFSKNYEAFKCSICQGDFTIGEGVVLKNCRHNFCKDDLSQWIGASQEFDLICPRENCSSKFQEREIRALVPFEVFDKILEKRLQIFQAACARGAFCNTPDCRGFVILEQCVFIFRCDICKKENCNKCKIIHEGKTCQEFRYENDTNDKHNLDYEDTTNWKSTGRLKTLANIDKTRRSCY